MRHNEILRFHSNLKTTCCKALGSSVPYTPLFLWLFFTLLLVSAAAQGTALAVISDRALVSYQFSLQDGSYAVLNIFDTSKKDANIIYLAGIKFLIKKNGSPEISETFHADYERKFVSSLIDGDSTYIEKVKQIQTILGVPDDGDPGKVTWKKLIEYFLQNSGQTLKFSSKVYRIIHIKHHDLSSEDNIQLETFVNTNQIHDNKLPLSIVQRAYGQFAPVNPTSPHPQDPKADETLKQEDESSQLKHGEGNPNSSPMDPIAGSGPKIGNQPEPPSSLFLRIFLWVKWAVIGICFLALIYLLYRLLRCTLDNRVRNQDEYLKNVQPQYNQVPQRNDHYNNPHLAGSDINQLSNRMRDYEQTQAKCLKNSFHQFKQMEKHLDAHSGTIVRYLNDESDRISTLDKSVKTIEKKIDEYKIQFDEYNNNMNEIKYSISKINKSLSIGLFATGQRDDSLPFLPEVHTQLEEYKALINRLEKKIDTLRGTGVTNLAVHNQETMADIEKNTAERKDEKPIRTVGIPNRKIDLSDSY
jgi:hypothetical protein